MTNNLQPHQILCQHKRTGICFAALLLNVNPVALRIEVGEYQLADPGPGGYLAGQRRR